MNVRVVEKVGDVKIYGRGLSGGKGEGLIKVNECNIPKAHKLRTRILTTTFYQRYMELDGKFGDEELDIVASILKKLANIPISVRSSATNEACVSEKGYGSVHAGENASFMLPNNHPDFSKRFNQLKQAIYHIYDDFIQKQPPSSKEMMAIVINPIPGIYDPTPAGTVYYPLVSGVANSYFPYALKTQDPKEGFARVAFGHGYATVMDDFPVISVATIRNPLPLRMLGQGQRYFYALDMGKNETLQGNELEAMRRLSIKLADHRNKKMVGWHKGEITFQTLVEDNQFAFRSGLIEIMDVISSQISSHFQIEFIFTADGKKGYSEEGTFHVVQLTQLPELKFESIRFPDQVEKTYLSVRNFQGHGIKEGIKLAVVVSPFLYAKKMENEVRRKISAINHSMRKTNDFFILIVPGRLGSRNKDWGIQIDYRDVDRAAAIFEYGVDIAGRAEPLKETENMTGGGIYGSHFLYMIQGGYDEDQKKIQTRMYGTQGTHFLTNLVSNNIVYGFIMPVQDRIEPWFFFLLYTNSATYVLRFPKAVSVYADAQNQRCVVMSETA
jgi:hypothetical protein